MHYKSYEKMKLKLNCKFKLLITRRKEDRDDTHRKLFSADNLDALNENWLLRVGDCFAHRLDYNRDYNVPFNLYNDVVKC